MWCAYVRYVYICVYKLEYIYKLEYFYIYKLAYVCVLISYEGNTRTNRLKVQQRWKKKEITKNEKQESANFFQYVKAVLIFPPLEVGGHMIKHLRPDGMGSHTLSVLSMSSIFLGQLSDKSKYLKIMIF